MTSSTVLVPTVSQSQTEALPATQLIGDKARDRPELGGCGVWSWLDASSDPMLAFERDSLGAWRVLDGNTAARKMVPGKVLAGGLLLDLLSPADVTAARESLQACWQRGEAANIRGAHAHASWQVWPLTTPGGQLGLGTWLLRVSTARVDSGVAASEACLASTSPVEPKEKAATQRHVQLYDQQDWLDDDNAGAWADEPMAIQEAYAAGVDAGKLADKAADKAAASSANDWSDKSLDWRTALALMRRRLTGVYEQAAIWCLEEDADGERVTVNPPAMQALGFDRAELAWTSLLKSVDQEDRRRFEDIRRERRRVRGPYALEARFRVSEAFVHNVESLGHDGGEAFSEPSVQGLAGMSGADLVRWMLVRSVPRFDARGQFDGYVSVAVDIHDRKQLEIDLVDLNTSLEQRVKARTVDLEAFTYSVSHDLRAPARAIGQFVRQLREREGTQMSDESRHLLSRVLSNAERMGGQIDNLLRFSQATVGAITRLKVDMQELADEVVERLRPGRQNLEVQFKPLPSAYVDPVLIQEVWASLIDNAIKYSRSRPVSRLEIGHNGAAYYVRDNGIGFDPERIAQLFDVFRRLHNDPSFEGQGVGLAVARRVIERHGGRIWAESTLDQGACFYFTLPG